MARSKNASANKAMGFLSRLRRDVRGNTLAIVAASMIPLIALAGGGIDVSRMYLAKVRLQHACDAGALAGRKAMGAGTWAQTNPNPNTIAQQFFDGNFKSGAYGTTNISRTYSENSGDVSGTASVIVPMTMMKFFGMPARTMSVACDAQMQLPNTDVMFVLDNTGSMLQKANSGDPMSKIDTLKNAVKCFYESVAQLKTNGTCANTTSGSGVNSSSQIRFGFVPYTTNVNVGKLLPTSYFVDNWSYQSRQYVSTNASWSSSQTLGSNIPCNLVPSDSTNTDYTKTNNGNGTCTVSATSKVVWHYGQISVNVGALKNGTAWNSSFTLPIADDGANKTINWDGCIEERATVKTAGNPSDFTPIPSGAKDLDIDMVPTSTGSTMWAPALPDLIYTRGGWSDSNWNNADMPSTTVPYLNGSNYYCPTAAKKLQTWSNPADFDAYVDSLFADGNTYHDIGLLWGARLMSPTGLFASENALTPQGGQIQRQMIFMTDGDTNTSKDDYAAYGVSWFDRRETTTAPPSNSDLDNQVNARFAALCTATKNKGITLWVISFGGNGIAATTKARLQACATDSNHYFDASSAASLNSAFQLIAAQITQLRLTK